MVAITYSITMHSLTSGSICDISMQVIYPQVKAKKYKRRVKVKLGYNNRYMDMCFGYSKSVELSITPIAVTHIETR